jgi:hypothetical protein
MDFGLLDFHGLLEIVESHLVDQITMALEQDVNALLQFLAL